MRERLTRREVCKAAAVSAAGALLGAAGACERKPAAQSAAAPPSSPKPTAPPPAAQTTRSLVVYCSADTDLAKPIIEEFTKQTSIRVEPVFDTEATKTTGLVNRLLQEKERARADLFWSSEPFGAIRLARAGVLDDSSSKVAEADMHDKGGWPPSLRDQRWLSDDPPARTAGPRWYGFGSRARVIVYNTKFITREDAPTDYDRFTLAIFKDHIGLANPNFGTTRGHMAHLLDAWNKGPFGEILRKIKGNGVKIYDGNSSVVRAVAQGEMHVGFTDSDDVFAGKREGWPVEMSFIKCPNPQAKKVRPGHPKWGQAQYTAKTGTLMLPNTISRVRGGPNPGGAPEFIDFMLSKETQKRMAQTESRNLPVDPELAREFGGWMPPQDDVAATDFEGAADVMESAMKICGEVFGL